MLPDLTVLGKIVGGGLPLAAFGGRAELMRARAGGRRVPGGDAFGQSSRDSRRPVRAAASPGTRTSMTSSSGMLAGWEEGLAESGRVQRVGSMLTLFATDRPCEGTSTTRKRATRSVTARTFAACWPTASTSRRHSTKRCSSRSHTATMRSTGPSRQPGGSSRDDSLPLGRRRQRARRESPLWAAALRAEEERELEPVFSPLGEERRALGVETIDEGYLLHYGRPRLFAPPAPEEALLLGDYLYAHGLVRVAELHDVGAVADLGGADLGVRSAAGRGWERGRRRLGGDGRPGRHQRARGGARRVAAAG